MPILHLRILLFGLCATVQSTSFLQLHDGATVNSSFLQQKATPESFLATHTNNSFATDFILSLYHNLRIGMPLSRATGRPAHWRDLKYTDTVRNFPTVGSVHLQNHLIFKFNMSATILPPEILRVAEMRFTVPKSWHQFNQLYATALITDKQKISYASSVSILTPHHIQNDSISIMDITLIITDVLKFFNVSSNEQIDNVTTTDIILTGVNQQKPTTRTKYLRQIEHLYKKLGNLETSAGRHLQPLEAILVAYTKVGDFPGNVTRNARQTPGVSVENILDVDLTDYQESDAQDLGSVNNISDGHEIRQKRAARNSNSYNNPTEHPCRKKDLQIDFTAIGWGEWVVYPTQFNAYQCHGVCAGYADSRSNPTNHAIVKSLVRLLGKHSLPMSCCTPTRLSPFSILYLEKGSVVIKHHEDMIVDECGCM